MANRVWGYCRVSTTTQNIERQERNIKKEYPDAILIREYYTGTKIERPEWNKLYKRVEKGDTIVFDEVSRMSRNAEEGFSLYKELFEKGVNLVFLKEVHINTDSYRDALRGAINTDVQSGDAGTDELINSIMNAVNRFMMRKVENDIYTAFERSQKEIDYLHQRTKEGMETARLNGKQIGGRTGSTYVTKRSLEVKATIQKYNKDFGGALNDLDTMKLGKIAKKTFYKYKNEMLRERENV